MHLQTSLVEPAVSQLRQPGQPQARYQTLIDQLTGAIRNTSDLNQIFRLAAEGVVATLQVSRCLVILLKYPNPLHKPRSAAMAIAQAKATVVAQAPLTCELTDVSKPALEERAASAAIDSDFYLGTWVNYSFRVSECPMCQQLLSQVNQSLAIPQPSTPLPEDYLEPDYAMSWVGDSTADFAPSIVNSAIERRSPTLSSQASKTVSILDLAQMPALIMVPLENQENVFGYLAVQHHQPCPWQMEELTFVKLVAAQVGTAIIQTRTLQQVQLLVEERTTQLQRSLEVQAKLYAKTRQQIHQLQELNRIKDEFLSTMSHELRTPLTSMMLAIRMLRQAELSPERRNKYLDVLEQQCVQETQLINDLLALQKLESGGLTAALQRINIQSLLRDLVQSHQDRLNEKQLATEIQCPDLPLNVQVDLDSLNRILTELLTNAGKYAIASSTIDIKACINTETSANFSRQTQSIRICLTNIGAGIDPQEIPYIFEKFRRGTGMTQKAVPGTGLGLALVKGLVEHISGTIAVSSTPLNAEQPQDSLWETSFVLTIPQMPIS